MQAQFVNWGHSSLTIDPYYIYIYILCIYIFLHDKVSMKIDYIERTWPIREQFQGSIYIYNIHLSTFKFSCEHQPFPDTELHNISLVKYIML